MRRDKPRGHPGASGCATHTNGNPRAALPRGKRIFVRGYNDVSVTCHGIDVRRGTCYALHVGCSLSSYVQPAMDSKRLPRLRVFSHSGSRPMHEGFWPCGVYRNRMEMPNLDGALDWRFCQSTSPGLHGARECAWCLVRVAHPEAPGTRLGVVYMGLAAHTPPPGKTPPGKRQFRAEIPGGRRRRGLMKRIIFLSKYPASCAPGRRSHPGRQRARGTPTPHPFPA